MISVEWEKMKLKYINAMYKEGMSVSKTLRLIKNTDAGKYILKELGFEKTIDKELKAYAARALLGMEAIAPVTEGTLQGIYEISKATFIKQIELSAQQLQKELMNAVLQGLSKKTLAIRVAEMSELMRKDQVETLVDTMTATYSRQVQAVMSRDVPDDTLYVYAGPVDDKTRPICLEMMSAGELTKAEIESQFPGSFVDGGGFNCRHEWRPVTKFTKETGLHRPDEAKKRIEGMGDKWTKPKTILEQQMEKA
jgi:murein L,D-transpeptidase YcbB/YkuD